MHLKKLIIDGFKSYGTRTEIKDFDPEFNAITGLNGTGKSNILDSICFVLGITNLSNVRASASIDLIYKSGQAGVTKGTVTAVFDNSDPTKSPINFEHQKEITVSRQIIVSGKNRYMINGIVVNNKNIFDFFKSVQLNINNPHFLIMQGRITKVLNMRPAEILSMIEEAAGTSMYEHKKSVAQKTVEKKDTKLKEMDDMVTEHINPKMERLKTERTQYLEFQKIQKEVENLNRITSAYYFVKLEENLEKEENTLKVVIKEIESLKSKKTLSEDQMKSIEGDIGNLNKKVDSEEGGVLISRKAELKELEMSEAKSTADYKNMESIINSEMNKKKLLVKSLKEDEKAFISKKEELGKAESVFNELREAQKKDDESLQAAVKKLGAVEQGKLSNEDGQDASLQDQLMAANEQLKQVETEVKMCSMQIDHAQKELKQKYPQLKQTETSFNSDSKDLEKKEKELANLKTHLDKYNYVEGELLSLEEQMKSIKSDIRLCNDTVDNFTRSYPLLKFTYKDPEPNFDRRKIRGLICSLFNVVDDRFVRALETAAGGKLYNVVVTDEHVSSKLIKNGKLARRTTFAPMNKIQGSRMNPVILKKAQSLVGGNNVFCAQDLIEYEDEYESVMSWVFGQIFICTDSSAGVRLCESRDIQRKAVTLDGDVFDPAGVISGGAVAKNDPILRVLIKVKKAENDLMVKQAELDNVMKKIDNSRQISASAKSYNRLKTEVEMIQARVQHTAHYQLKQEIAELQKTISEKSSRVDECKKSIKDKEKKVKELEHKMKNLQSIKDNELKAAQIELKKAEKRAEDSKNKWIKREQEYEDLNLEIQELEKAVAKGKADLVTSEAFIDENKQHSNEAKNKLENIQSVVKRTKDEVKALEEEIGKKNAEIRVLIQKKDKQFKTICDCDITITSKEVEKSKSEDEIKNIKGSIHEMKRKNKWIETDRQYFGLPNGLYDFTTRNPEDSAAKLRKLEEMKQKMDKLVNAKALDVLGSQEEQFQEVLNKKVIVEEDRSKILSVIEELDVKKEEVIKTAWEQVNGSFNSILDTLLPGFNAKLQPIEGRDFMDGLQIKVGLGGIWKETLDELSGGQRSLVALSLILAMLLFKPAPLYILDEVDAALDQSHTQNIGQMLKKHFKQSQFIVVSLKDGMFTNANVLYKTSFVDGMSKVTRTTPHKQH